MLSLNLTFRRSVQLGILNQYFKVLSQMLKNKMQMFLLFMFLNHELMKDQSLNDGDQRIVVVPTQFINLLATLSSLLERENNGTKSTSIWISCRSNRGS